MQKNSYLPNPCLFLVALLSMFTAATARESFTGFTQSMDVVINDFTYEYHGRGASEFVNESGDTLHQLFYHAYFNAFQPGSALAAHAEEHGAREIAERIRRLGANQQGALDIDSCTVNGKPATTERTGTIIRIDLPEPLAPGTRVRVAFSLWGRIPWITRRAGRNNSQDIRYSMAQWYPKLCQYDEQGWHNNQYLLREFFGVFGSYDVRITLPARYIVGATGEVQNPDAVGHGYQFARDTTVLPSKESLPGDSMLTWHFRANNVHDFAWVADESYAHTIAVHGSTTIHILHNESLLDAWSSVAKWCSRTLDAFGAMLGAYPYSTFTCAQAGDGGMEYPQLIMIQHRDRYDMLHTVVHEIAHQWFYGLIATNEVRHAWMDEGFTEYIEHRLISEQFPEEALRRQSFLQRLLVPERPFAIATELTFLNVMRTGLDQPLCTPHDRFDDYAASWIVYDKGMALLRQLEYSFGRKALDSCLKRYALAWRYGHPYPRDFEKICEEVFGQRMDDIFDTFIGTTEVPDYEIVSITSDDSAGMYTTTVELQKNGIAHVPLTLYARLSSDRWITRHIPSDVRYSQVDSLPEPWLWMYPSYSLKWNTTDEIEEVRLDTTHMLLDFTAENNTARSRLFFPSIPPVRLGLWQRFDQAVPLAYYGISVRPTLWRFAPHNWQAGVRADGLIDFDRYRTTAGVYFNSASGKIDWQAAFSHPFHLLGPLSSYSLRVWSMDGTRHASASLTTLFRERYSAPERWTLTLLTDYWEIGASLPFSPFAARHNELYRVGTSARYDWRSGSVLLEAIAAGSRDAGVQAATTVRWAPSAALHLRLFATAATPRLPGEQLYSLHTATPIAQFENVPYRFAAGLAPGLKSLFLPGGGAFTASDAPPMRTIISLHAELRNWYLLSGTGLPVLEKVEAGAYGSAAVAANTGVFATSINELYAEAGIFAALDLNDILPQAHLLWMFTEKPVISIFLPLARHTPGEGFTAGSRGVKLGIGTAL